MKKALLTIIMVLLVSTSLFAYTDNYYSTSTDPLYVELLSAIKNGEKESVILSAYNNYLSSDATEVEKARVENHLARYYKDKKKKTIAKEHIALMREEINAIDKTTISDFDAQVLEVEYLSAKFYVEKKMSDGLENSNLTKKLREQYPDDVFVIMTDCWRLIYTPGIAGGSPKRAIRELEALLDGYKDQLAPLDEYSIYCALAIANNMRGDYLRSDEYFNLAFKFYSKEAEVVSAYKENLEQLQK